MITKVILNQSAARAICDEVYKCPQKETGGVLCGFYEGSAIVVASASGPGPNASKSLIEFTMDKGHMHTFLDKEYSASLGQNIYVGEWHTHPEIYPHPSVQDEISIVERSLEWEHGELAFLIFGFYKFSSTRMRKNNVCLHYDPKENRIWEIPLLFND